MSAQGASGPSSSTPPKSGIRAALEYTGIPASWLSKRPKLPSRNWLIFISLTSSVAGLYFYDRRQCKNIRQRYVDRVKHLAEEPLDVLSWPRRVTVYGSKWPGDEEFEQSVKYFRKYVKPILVAAAVDYEIVNGKRHGDLANRIAEEVKSRRRLDLGIDILPESLTSLVTYKPPDERRRYELDGGMVIIGRPTFKEFMEGLKRGWTATLEKIDKDEALARVLELDGRFDEPDEAKEAQHEFNGANNPVQNSPVFSPYSPPLRQAPPLASALPASLDTPPATIPPLPPILFVSFTNHIGFTQIPIMIWEFFNQRHKALSGAEAAYRLVMKRSRPIEPPSASEQHFSDLTSKKGSPDQGGDLDFDKHAESWLKSSLSKIPADIENAQTKYYEALREKLKTARDISRGIREMTKAEIENPPPTEVELRAERMKKERRWRNDLEGWGIVRPDQKVAWDDRFRDALRVFVDPPQDEDSFDDVEK